MDERESGGFRSLLGAQALTRVKTEEVCFYTLQSAPAAARRAPPEWLAHALALRSKPRTLRLHALQPYLPRPSPSDTAQTNLKSLWELGSLLAPCLGGRRQLPHRRRLVFNVGV